MFNRFVGCVLGAGGGGSFCGVRLWEEAAGKGDNGREETIMCM